MNFLALIQAVRPKQWTKNIVVFAAFVFALGDQQQAVGLSAFWDVLKAALLFCTASGGIYLVNDLKDIELDRLHPEKKNRPIAAGILSKPTAHTAAVLLLGFSIIAARWVDRELVQVIMAYIILQLAYTFGLKRIALVDLFVIAAGFVLRALAGAVTLNVTISPWLLLCTLLLALFLALCKRRNEKVSQAESTSETRPSLADYDERLLDQLIAIVSSACVVCYALYTLWPETVAKFGTHQLSFTIPFVIFGIFRYLDLVYRHEKGERPEQILLTDLPLLADILLYGLTVLLILAR